MPSLTTSLSNLITSIFSAIASFFTGILAVLQSILSTFFDLANTILATFATFLAGILHTFQGVATFLLGNIVVLGAIGLAAGGYVVYQNRRGGAVTVPGTAKKVN